MGLAAGLPDGRAQLCGRPFAARQEDGAWPAAPAAEIIFLLLRRSLDSVLAGAHLIRRSSTSSLRPPESGHQRLARVAADPFDHRTQAVRTLLRQMLAESELVEHGDRVGVENLLRRAVRIKRQQDRDQSPHDMGVAIATVFQQRFAVAVAPDTLRQPNLAG